MPFEVPARRRAARSASASVLEVIYLVFNEGYSATAGDDWMRPALCEEALRLGRILAELAPRRAGGARPGRADGDPGLALSARASGRDGEPVLLLDQDRARWDQLLIRRGLAALARAEALGGAARALRAAGRDRRLPRAGAHAPRTTDWARIAALYDALAQLTPSPVVELNRAVAVAMAFGPAAGPGAGRRPGRRAGARRATTCCPSVRGDLLAKLGPRRRGARRVRARGGAHPQRPRAEPAPGARRRLRLRDRRGAAVSRR